jgi:hypothetical protein
VDASTTTESRLPLLPLARNAAMELRSAPLTQLVLRPQETVSLASTKSELHARLKNSPELTSLDSSGTLLPPNTFPATLNAKPALPMEKTSAFSVLTELQAGLHQLRLPLISKLTSLKLPI